MRNMTYYLYDCHIGTNFYTTEEYFDILSYWKLFPDLLFRAEHFLNK